MMLKLALLICGVFQSVQLSQTEQASCLCSINYSDSCCRRRSQDICLCPDINPALKYKEICNITCQELNCSDNGTGYMTSEPGLSTREITTSSTSEYNCDQMAKNGEVPALGAVVGLLVVALIVTTTGWVWTCCLLKKRGKMDANSQQIEYPSRYNSTLDTTPSVRQLHNPTYDGNNMQPPPPTTATDQAHNRDAISVVITPQEGEPQPIISNDQLGTMEQQQSIPRLSNNSQHINVGGETETNIYYVLERPGDDDDYEDLDAELDAAEERAQAENNQGANLYHVQEGPTLETEGSENTTKEAHVNGE